MQGVSICVNDLLFVMTVKIKSEHDQNIIASHNKHVQQDPDKYLIHMFS